MANKRSDNPPVNQDDDKQDDDKQTKKQESGGGLQGTSTGTLVAEITRQVLTALEKKQPLPQGEPSYRSPHLSIQPGCDQLNRGEQQCNQSDKGLI